MLKEMIDSQLFVENFCVVLL